MACLEMILLYHGFAEMDLEVSLAELLMCS